MGSLSFIAMVLFIAGVLQIVYPELFIKLKVQGVKTPNAVRLGGFVVVPVSIIIFIVDILK